MPLPTNPIWTYPGVGSETDEHDSTNGPATPRRQGPTEATVVTRGWLKASHRAFDENRSTLGRPYHPHQDPKSLEPGKLYEFRIEVWPTSYVFPEGHRIRIGVVPGDSPIVDAPFSHHYGLKMGNRYVLPRRGSPFSCSFARCLGRVDALTAGCCIGRTTNSTCRPPVSVIGQRFSPRRRRVPARTSQSPPRAVRSGRRSARGTPEHAPRVRRRRARARSGSSRDRCLPVRGRTR